MTQITRSITEEEWGERVRVLTEHQRARTASCLRKVEEARRQSASVFETDFLTKIAQMTSGDDFVIAFKVYTCANALFSPQLGYGKNQLMICKREISNAFMDLLSVYNELKTRSISMDKCFDAAKVVVCGKLQMINMRLTSLKQSQ